MNPDDFDLEIKIGTFWSVAIIVATVAIFSLSFVGLVSLVKSG